MCHHPWSGKQSAHITFYSTIYLLGRKLLQSAFLSDAYDNDTSHESMDTMFLADEHIRLLFAFNGYENIWTLVGTIWKYCWRYFENDFLIYWNHFLSLFSSIYTIFQNLPDILKRFLFFPKLNKQEIVIFIRAVMDKTSQNKWGHKISLYNMSTTGVDKKRRILIAKFYAF